MVLGGAYQGDGFTSVLFENPGWPKHAWIVLELEGRGANRSALAARVDVVVSDADGKERTVRRTARTGGSFGAGSAQLHVGLGPAARVREVRIQWPDSLRTRTSYSGLTLDRAYRISQGAAPVLLNRPAVPFPPAAAAPAAHAHPAPRP